MFYYTVSNTQLLLPALTACNITYIKTMLDTSVSCHTGIRWSPSGLQNAEAELQETFVPSPDHIVFLTPPHHGHQTRPPLQLFNRIVLTEKESPQTLQLVSSSSWNRGLLPPTKESSAVSCGHACVRMNNQKPHSCNALIFTQDSGDCQLGIAALASGRWEDGTCICPSGTFRWTSNKTAGASTCVWGKFGAHCVSRELFHPIKCSCEDKIWIWKPVPAKMAFFSRMFSQVYSLTNTDVFGTSALYRGNLGWLPIPSKKHQSCRHHLYQGFFINFPAI